MGANALAPEPALAPMGAIDWREKLHTALMELGMTFTADAVEHSKVSEAGNVLQFVTPKQFMLAMRVEDIAKAAQRASGRMFQIKVTAGEAERAEPAAGSAQPQGDASRRALENPEVKKYLEVFGAGEVRAVRDLKKIE
jgi:hypothetical protein